MSTININVSRADMGLDQVDNTSDLNKPISTATQTALDDKVDKVTGSRLITSAEATLLGNTSGTNTGDQTLQDVTTEGNTTTDNISFTGAVGVLFDNTSTLRKGTIDAGYGGAKGIAQICSVGYELKWEAGRLYVMGDGGTTIREVSHNFTTTPSATDDNTKGFIVGSRWILDNGDLYICSDVTTATAVWVLKTFEDTTNKAIDFTTVNDTKYPTVKAVDDHINSKLAGLWDDRGSYDASTNLFPSSGGSGGSGAILKGDIWTINVQGTLGGTVMHVGDTVRALVDTPAQTSINWALLENAIGYVPENVTNKVTTFSGNTTSDTKYPSVKAVVDNLSSYALDNAVVKLTGNQSVGGIKTFTSELKLNDKLYLSETATPAATTGYTTLTSNGSQFVLQNGSSTAAATFVFNGARTYTLPNITGTLLSGANNLSDLTNTTTARTNLGLGSLATQSGTFSGTSSGSNTGDQDLSNYQPYTTATTGSVISFIVPQVYNSVATPSSSNITDSLTSAKIGIVQKIYHNHTVAPTFPAGWVKMGTATYTTSTLNVIFAEWVSSTRVEYWITKPS